MKFLKKYIINKNALSCFFAFLLRGELKGGGFGGSYEQILLEVLQPDRLGFFACETRNFIAPAVPLAFICTSSSARLRKFTPRRPCTYCLRHRCWLQVEFRFYVLVWVLWLASFQLVLRSYRYYLFFLILAKLSKCMYGTIGLMSAIGPMWLA